MGKKIVIIGGGVIGLCTAYYCMRKGHKVTIIDRGRPEPDNCSVGNAGMIVPSHFIPLAAPGIVAAGLKMMWNPQSPFFVRPRLDAELLDWGFKFIQAATKKRVAKAAPLLLRLSLESRRCFLELAASPQPGFGLALRGLLMLCRTRGGFHEETHAAHEARELGLAADVLTPEETAKLEPDIDMDIAGSVYFPEDCHLCPNRFLHALTTLLRPNGAVFRHGANVIDWRTVNDRIDCVRTNHGNFEADEFVVAAGSWSPTVLKGLGVYLPMQAGKGYSLTLSQPPQLPGHCAILKEARVAVTPMDQTLRFGGTMELGGLDDSINPLRVKGIIKSSVKYFPGFSESDFDSAPAWSGLRPCSPDGLPYLGRTRLYHNMSVASGHAMLGLSLGPISGRLLAQVLSDEEPDIDMELLHPDRYCPQFANAQ